MAARDIVPVPGAQFEETLASASPDVLREMIKGFAQRMMDADVEVRGNAGYGEVTPRAGELAQRLPAPGVGHPGRDDRAGDPEAAGGHVLPGVPGAPAARGAGPGLGGGDQLPAGRLDPADARDDILAFTAFPREVWRQVWSNNPQVISSLN